MTRRGKSAGVALAAACALAWLGSSAVRAGETAPDDWSPEGAAGHDSCTVDGRHREAILRAGLAAQIDAAERRSALTRDVVARLATTASAAPSRSRSASRSAAGSAETSLVDRHIFAAMRNAGVAPAPETTDAEFLRRVTLDLTGRIPAESEVLSFLNDASADRRERAVARLLETPQWVDRWTMFLGDLFRNTTLTAQVNRFPDGRDGFYLFLRRSLERNEPYDRLVREMLAASGTNDGRAWPPERGNQSGFDTFEQYQAFARGTPAGSTAASYIVGGLTTGGPIHDTYDTLAAFAARDLLGVTYLDCILCHDGLGHLESVSVWGAQAKRAEAWGMAAFFRQVRLRRPFRVPPPPGQAQGPNPPYWIVEEVPAGQVLRNARGFLTAGEYSLDTATGNRPARTPDQAGGAARIEPRYPFGGGQPLPGEPLREALGRLLTADRQFARAAVNYVWREFFGRGIVEPADQFDLARLDAARPPPDPWTLQPSHPELLEALAEGFERSGYNLKWLMGEIANSRAYQLSARYEGAWSPAYERYFARRQARRLQAEAMLDAVTLATEVPLSLTRNGTLGPTNFAMQLTDVSGQPGNQAIRGFLDAFLRGDREETPRGEDFSVLQALQAMNSGPVVVNRVSQSGATGSVARLLGENDETFVGRLYLTALGRFATPEELAAGVAHMRAAGGTRRERGEDLLWALMNKVDFLFNY